jgi:hypothetical protein
MESSQQNQGERRMFSRNRFFIKWNALAIRSNLTVRKSIEFSTRRWVLACYRLMANLALAAESAPK